MARPTKNRRTNKLSRAQKIAEVQALKEQSFTYSQIMSITGLSKQCVADYLKIKTEVVDRIKTVIKNHNIEHDFKTAELARNRIVERLQDNEAVKKTRLYELTGVYKTARDLQEPRVATGIGAAIQVNINIDKDTKAFSIEG